MILNQFRVKIQIKNSILIKKIVILKEVKIEEAMNTWLKVTISSRNGMIATNYQWITSHTSLLTKEAMSIK